MGRGANSTPPRGESDYEGTLLYILLLAKYIDRVLELTPHPRGHWALAPLRGFLRLGSQQHGEPVTELSVATALLLRCESPICGCDV